MQGLSDAQRRAIHDLALGTRELLLTEAREVLEGTYGLYADGHLDPPAKLPELQHDPEKKELYDRLASFIDDEAHAGLSRADAVAKLTKEIAFTHLNRFAAFKMMEARKLIRGTLDKGTDSNAFKYYLADPEHAEDLARHQAGKVDTAYRHFLLWQCGQVARELNVLFDPNALAGRIFPRPHALQELLGMLNDPDLAPAWLADETIGWIYQYFNEEEKAEVFARLYKQKQRMRPQDIPAATQLFTPHWIVRFLVQNTLGRLWVQMHPDTRLAGTPLFDYLVPLEGDIPSEPLRPVREVTLLDPACGTMHFGLVAFDLFAAMYEEELDHAGDAGWPAEPSVSDKDEIAAAIIAHNLYGIDIDLRAVQLSALTLYLKAKSLNKDARITASNLACADVLALNGACLGAFLREARFEQPIYERIMRKLWERLREANEFGSLLRLEQELGELVSEERTRYEKTPLFAGLPGEFERAAAEAEFWSILEAQIIQGLDQFARQQATAGVDLSLFRGEAVKGLRLLDVMVRHYDVVTTNPPYAASGNVFREMAGYLSVAYPLARGDLYAAFIQRCSEFLEQGGRLGMITQQSFMFLSSYKQLRERLREQFAIEAIAHTGPRAFAEISGEKVNTAAFVLRAEQATTLRQNSIGTYHRLVHAPTGDGKRQALEQTLRDGSLTHHLTQRRFDAIPGSPWVYWVAERVRGLFESPSNLASLARPVVGLQTSDNFRFLRYWWEAGQEVIAFSCQTREEAHATGRRWFPHMKGGEYHKWYGNQEYIVNWAEDGAEIRNFYGPDGRLASRPQNLEYYFREGVTWTHTTAKGLNVRYLPPGFICNVEGMAAYPSSERLPATSLLGIMNSRLGDYAIGMLNPSIHYGAREVQYFPLPPQSNVASPQLERAVVACVRLAKSLSFLDETTFDFILPPFWTEGLSGISGIQTTLAALGDQMDAEVYRLYGIEDVDRVLMETDSMSADGESERGVQDMEDAAWSREDLAVRWISYAVGIVLARFAAGQHALADAPSSSDVVGRALYQCEDLRIGSLPVPSEADFDGLLQPLTHIAYTDQEQRRHAFANEAENALRTLVAPDGICVLDEGHERDLSALVEKALGLMLGDQARQEVIQIGAAGDLPRFLERDYFTKWHLKWYRKRPVYWWLQSSRGSYGFVIFHEKVEADTLYRLQRDYLDYKVNAVRNTLQDLQSRHEGTAGREAKQLEHEMESATKLLDELTEFGKTIERIAREGYVPEPNWIDDGIILRLAPLWELMPLWKSEPKKYWERLQKGDYDWSHIAMRYWPERVREKCRTNKSFAIAHGHEEWYEGG